MHDQLVLGHFSGYVPTPDGDIYMDAVMKPSATVATCRIPTGQYEAGRRNWDRTYRVVSGCGTRIIGETIEAFRPGDQWDVDAGTLHGLVQIEEDAVVEVTQHMPNRSWS